MNDPTRRDDARPEPDYERLADSLPERVIRAVADAVTPQEIGSTSSAATVNEFPVHVWDRARDALGGAA